MKKLSDKRLVQYYVEGEDEKKLIDVLKTDLRMIRTGKVQVMNPVQAKLTNARLRTLKPGTVVVLVFDTDTDSADILRENIETLEKHPYVSEVVIIPQVKNLEAELVRSCDIKRITELLGSKSKKEFKADLIRATNLADKLRQHQFDIEKFWCGQPGPPYGDEMFRNRAEKVKI